jgi:5-deoxy-D-glucuronate isomerase
MVCAPPGCGFYYLNVMTGHQREGKVKNGPDHEWLLE